MTHSPSLTLQKLYAEQTSLEKESLFLDNKRRLQQEILARMQNELDATNQRIWQVSSRIAEVGDLVSRFQDWG